MAVYVGVNGQAKKVKNIYVGVNGQAKKVSEGYIGVNGEAKKFWGNESGSIELEYDYVPNQLYSIHNKLTILETMDYAYQEWYDHVKDIPFLMQSEHISFFISNWDAVKMSALNSIASVSIEFTACYVEIQGIKTVDPSSIIQSDSGSVSIKLSQEVFPKDCLVNYRGNDIYNNDVISLTDYYSYLIPRGTYVCGSGTSRQYPHTIRTNIIAQTSDLNNIGYWDTYDDETHRSCVFTTRLSSYGMKKT